MLVYLGREWCRVTVKELGKRLHRDSSVISRLYSMYAADRVRSEDIACAALGVGPDNLYNLGEIWVGRNNLYTLGLAENNVCSGRTAAGSPGSVIGDSFDSFRDDGQLGVYRYALAAARNLLFFSKL